MQQEIYIVKYCNPDGSISENSTIKIIQSSKLKDITKTRTGVFGKIDLKFWGDDGDSYSIESQPVRVEHTFAVLTSGQFIRNPYDNSTLNAYNMSGGFRQINRLAFQWSATIIEVERVNSLYDNHVIWTESGIKATKYDMYSYHVNEPKQEYIESRLDWEVWESLDFEKILANYLGLSDIRDAKLGKLGL